MQNICELNLRTLAARPKQEPAEATALGTKSKKSTDNISKTRTNGGTAWIAVNDINRGPVMSPNSFSDKADEVDAAGSDDASEPTVAIAVAPSAAAGADRDATADLAESAEGKKRPVGAALPSAAKGTEERKPGAKAGATPDSSGKPRRVSRGKEPLPEDAEAYVDAVHSQVDLVKLEVQLLKSLDEKIVQRELACLRELRYGKRAPEPGDEPPQIVFDIPRPQRTQ